MLGDFNALATLLVSPRTEARNEVLVNWAAGLYLRLNN